MARDDRTGTKRDSAVNVPAGAGDVVDCGTGSLELPGAHDAALEITEFLEADSRTSAAPAVDAQRNVAAAPRDGTSGKIALPAAKRPGILRTVFGFIAWVIRSLFGIASLIVLLAVIAAIPIVSFLALGYLLEVEGRVARSGKLRDAFPLLDVAPRLGTIALGIWLWMWPLRLLSDAAADARLIDPGSAADRGLHMLVLGLTIAITGHVCLALARGGSLGSFFRPIKNLRWLLARSREGNYWSGAETAVRDFLARLRLKHHFLLGFRGYVGAMAWLILPTTMFAASNAEGISVLVTIVGGAFLMLVLSWVPFLQAHFAAENRFGAMFELGTVRDLYRHAPFSWLVTMLITLTLALPLYLFKIVIPPRDALWMETLVFIVSIYPLKVLTGWAYHRALTREQRTFWTPEEVLTGWRSRRVLPASLAATTAATRDADQNRLAARDLARFHRYVGKKLSGGVIDTLVRWLSRGVLVPLLAFYVFLLFFTQFISEHGKGVLFEHHAFLLPVPMLW